MENILVIEDDLMFGKLLSNYLNKNGYSASQATDGTSAKAQLQDSDFDLALIDYRLPDTNGIDLVKWIEANALNVQVIMMSRTLDGNLQAEASDLGVSGFLDKPFNPAELLDLLEEIK